MSPKRQLQFWGIGFALFVLVFWLLGSTLLPFLLGAGIAYFLDPLADRLQRLGLSRLVATAVIAVDARSSLFVAVLVFAVPALIAQVQALVVAVPDYIAQPRRPSSGGAIPTSSARTRALMRNLSGFETMLREGGLTVC